MKLILLYLKTYNIIKKAKVLPMIGLLTLAKHNFSLLFWTRFVILHVDLTRANLLS